MRVGILGSGDVAKSFGRGFLKEGNEVMLGSRDPEKLASWVRESGENASSGTLAETAKLGELLVIAVNGQSRGSDPDDRSRRIPGQSRHRQIPWTYLLAFRRN